MLKALIRAVTDRYDLAAENVGLREKLAKKEQSFETLANAYEALSKKYFAKLAEKPGRYPAVKTETN